MIGFSILRIVGFESACIPGINGKFNFAHVRRIIAKFKSAEAREIHV
jgi:hypothetical protein